MDTKFNSLNTGIKIFLNVILCLGFVCLVQCIVVYMSFPKFIQCNPNVLVLILSVIAYCCGLAICYQLTKINNTLIDKKPFVMENVKRVHKIAICLFIISLYVFVKDWVNLKGHIFAYFINRSGFITDSEFLIFVFVGILVLLLAKIFKTAIIIKEENDLTV